MQVWEGGRQEKSAPLPFGGERSDPLEIPKGFQLEIPKGFQPPASCNPAKEAPQPCTAPHPFGGPTSAMGVGG